MKMFKGNRPLDDVLNDMKEKGMQADKTEFNRGGDFILFSGEWFGFKTTISFNTFNGRFFGKRESENTFLKFSESSDYLDDTKWYSALLDMFYIPKEEAE